MHAYESIVEEETLKEIESWPDGVEIRSAEPFMRITLNITCVPCSGCGRRADGRDA